MRYKIKKYEKLSYIGQYYKTKTVTLYYRALSDRDPHGTFVEL